LLSGESVFIEIPNQKMANPTKNSTPYPQKSHLLKGTWQVDFLKGEPFLPSSFKTDTLVSWTALGDSTAQYFSGTARYTLRFSLSNEQIRQKAVLDLGDVREVADVKLNGKLLGTAWCLPMNVEIPQGILQKENSLEVQVTNVSANRIRYMDKKGVPWKHFYDINMVDIGYRPFDASQWKPVKSGLLGNVKLIF
jgi:hypothetical protein